MNCSQCGAPLPPKSNLCRYCAALNDIDLRTLPGRTADGPQSDRHCPDCATPLTKIDIGGKQRCWIERCDTCLGLFFDPGELDHLVKESESVPGSADYQRLWKLTQEESIFKNDVRYRPCPVCRELMNRRRYGVSSGVIIDCCAKHGVWLDAGELGHLIKWVKAGGGKVDQQRREEEARREQIAERVARRQANIEDVSTFGEILRTLRHLG